MSAGNETLPDAGPAPFDALSPDAIAQAVEAASGRRVSGSLVAYPSYVNRVYGLGLEDGGDLIVKFYRPGRWAVEALLEEHRFLLDCAEAEIPVAAPLRVEGGGTLGELVLGDPDDEGGADTSIFFALFKKMGGRSFDAENDSDWRRLGSIVGRCHRVGALRDAPHRLRCDPATLSRAQAMELLDLGLVHPDRRSEFAQLCEESLSRIERLFTGIRYLRIHGDCHRGNILERPGEGLLLIDFDDMMTGPAIQDLWLLLPGRATECGRELSLLAEGYGDFAELDSRELALVEPLRLMRMIHFLAWMARQRRDRAFAQRHPGWGSEAFWIKEIEDLRDQAGVVEQTLDRRA